MVEEVDDCGDLKCAVCGANDDIVRHHTSYSPERTVPLCRKCHGKLHMDSLESDIPAPIRVDRCSLTGAPLKDVEESPNVHQGICNASDICGNRSCPFSTDSEEDFAKWIRADALEDFAPWLSGEKKLKILEE